MAGTIDGGRAAAKTIKKKYGTDFYAKIGASGGRKSRNGGFASMLLDSNGLTGPQRAITAGIKGGSISRRGPSRNLEEAIDNAVEPAKSPSGWHRLKFKK